MSQEKKEVLVPVPKADSGNPRREIMNQSVQKLATKGNPSVAGKISIPKTHTNLVVSESVGPKKPPLDPSCSVPGGQHKAGTPNKVNQARGKVILPKVKSKPPQVQVPSLPPINNKENLEPGVGGESSQSSAKEEKERREREVHEIMKYMTQDQKEQALEKAVASMIAAKGNGNSVRKVTVHHPKKALSVVSNPLNCLAARSDGKVEGDSVGHGPTGMDVCPLSGKEERNDSDLHTCQAPNCD